FSNTQFSGTIITLTETPIQEQYIDKIVYVSKKYAYPWEYDQILIGDSLSNGKEKVFEILEKAKGETNEIIFNDFGKFIPLETESYKYIYLKAKLRVKLEDKKYIYAEEMVISPGRGLNIATNNLTFNDYIITRVE
ncbi:MAG: hypothetical protein NTZ55_04290, partial [Candidatus Roizmanbacteria bacterium]|nr:hypothetical protein [Candidatus Roizmanbacteria bacterium]